MVNVVIERLRSRLAGTPSAQELGIALEEIQVLSDELGQRADRLAHERERNAVLFDRSPLACVITDFFGNVRESNLAALALLDVPVSYLTGKPLAIFIADDDRESFRMKLAMAARPPGQPVETWDSRIKSPSGRPREMQVDLRASQAAGNQAALLFWFLSEARA